MKKLLVALVLTLFLFGCGGKGQVEPEIYKVDGWPDKEHEAILHIDENYALLVGYAFGGKLDENGNFTQRGVTVKYYNLTNESTTFNTADVELIDKEDHVYNFDYNGIEVKPYDTIEQEFLIKGITFQEPFSSPQIYEYLNGINYKDVSIDFTKDYNTIKRSEVPATIKAYQDKIGEQD